MTIRKLLLDEPPLIILPRLATLVGLDEAIMLQQIHYWLEHYRMAQDARHFHDGRWWVWNTYEGWKANFPFWSTRTIRRVVKSLREEYRSKGGDDPRIDRPALLLVGNFNLARYDRTLWYTILYDHLSELPNACGQNGQMDQDKVAIRSGQNGQMDQDKVAAPIPETTPEITSKITSETMDPTPTREDGPRPVVVVGGSIDQVSYNKLTEIGVQEPTASELARTCDRDQVIAWCEYAPHAKGVDNPPGLVIKKLQAGTPAPKPKKARSSDRVGVPTIRR